MKPPFFHSKSNHLCLQQPGFFRVYPLENVNFQDPPGRPATWARISSSRMTSKLRNHLGVEQWAGVSHVMNLRFILTRNNWKDPLWLPKSLGFEHCFFVCLAFVVDFIEMLFFLSSIFCPWWAGPMVSGDLMSPWMFGHMLLGVFGFADRCLQNICIHL